MSEINAINIFNIVHYAKENGICEGEAQVPDEHKQEAPYILCYFRNYQRKHLNFVNMLREKSHCNVVVVVSKEKNSLLFYQKNVKYLKIEVTSKYFLQLLSRAQYVCTDSFDVVSYAIVNEKSFFVFHDDKKANSSNSRINWLLDTFGFQDRLVREDTQITAAMLLPISYDIVRIKLNQLQNKKRYADGIH